MKRSNGFNVPDVVEVVSPPARTPVQPGEKGTVVEILSSDTLEVEFVVDDGTTRYLGPFPMNNLRKPVAPRDPTRTLLRPSRGPSAKK